MHSGSCKGKTWGSQHDVCFTPAALSGDSGDKPNLLRLEGQAGDIPLLYLLDSIRKFLECIFKELVCNAVLQYMNSQLGVRCKLRFFIAAFLRTLGGGRTFFGTLREGAGVAMCDNLDAARKPSCPSASMCTKSRRLQSIISGDGSKRWQMFAHLCIRRQEIRIICSKRYDIAHRLSYSTAMLHATYF